MVQQRRNAPAGAPLKFTDDLRKQFLEGLRDGLARQDACAAVGVDRSTVYRARQADPGFAVAIDQAEAEATRVCVNTIWKAVKRGDPKWASWWLAHRRPREWGDQAIANDADRNADTELGSLLRSLDGDRSVTDASPF